MVLADTSVWIDFFRGERNGQVELLEKLIDSGRGLVMCGIVLTEILVGARSDHQVSEMMHLFGSLTLLPMDEAVYVSAAELYRIARKSGRTVRRVPDCLIAACAIAHSASLHHRDRDFDTLASVSKLKIV